MDERIMSKSSISNQLLKFSAAIALFPFIITAILWKPMGFEYYGRFIPYTFIVVFVIIAVIIYLANKNNQLVITDKRVYGITTFGKRVDIHLDSISAISVVSSFLSSYLAVSSSSGLIKFSFIDNVNEMHKVLNGLLNDRQNNRNSAPVNAQSVSVSTIQTNAVTELKQYKELLDQGVISQEEFDAKKKQLLNL